MTTRITALLSVALLVTPLVGAPPPAAAAETSAERVLVFTSKPDGAVAGETIGSPQVELRDGENKLVEGTITLSTSTGATLDCGTDGTSKVTNSGVATFGPCSLVEAGAHQLVATSGTASVSSNSFTVTAGAPSELRLSSGTPSTVQAGAPLAPSPTLTIVDAFGNPANGSGYSAGLIALDASGIPVALDGCDGTTAVEPDLDDGQSLYATFRRKAFTVSEVGFTGCSISQAGSHSLLGVALTQNESDEVLSVESAAFGVTVGAPAALAFTTQPRGGEPGGVLTGQPVVTLVDSLGNPVSGTSASVTLSLTAADDATLNCSSNNVGTTDGRATFAGCQVDLAGTYTLTAAAEGFISATSASFEVALAGDATELVFVNEPAGGSGGSAFTDQPAVEILDASGQRVPGTVELELVERDTTGGRLDCVYPTVPAMDGLASFFGCDIDRPGTYQLQASTTDGLTATSESFEIAVGPSVAATIDEIDGSEAGASFGVSVAVFDAAGNAVIDDGEMVRIAASSLDGGVSGPLTCVGGRNATTVAGVATFDCSIDTPGTYRITAVAERASAIGNDFQIATGPPASLTFLSGPATALDGGLLATPIVLVEDAGGNAVDATVNLSTQDATLDDDCITSRPTTEGVAAFPGCVVSISARESFELVASADTASARSEVSVGAGAPVGTAPAAQVPLGQTFGGQLYAADPSFDTNDVNAATGSLAFGELDLTVAGVGVPLELVRAYHSTDTSGGLFGTGWTSVFDAGVTVDRNSATVRGEDGQQVVFTRPDKCGKNANCDWVAPPSARSTLRCKGSECTVVRHDGTMLTSVDGRVQTLVSRFGHGLTFRYGSDGELDGVDVATTAGVPTAVDVEVIDGRIASVTTPTRTVTYSYDNNGRLATTTDPVGNVTTYGYADDRLTSAAVGAERLDVEYDGAGAVSKAARSGSENRFADTYVRGAGDDGVSITKRATAVTARGLSTVGQYEEWYVGNVLVQERFPDGGVSAYQFDDSFNLVAFQDPKGHVVRMTYSPAGDLVREENATGGVVTYTYDDHRITSLTDAAGNTTEYSYSGNSGSWIVPPDPAKDPDGSAGVRGEIGTKQTYDEFGLLVEVVTPLAVRTFTYDAAGNAVSHQLFDRADTDRLDPLDGLGPLSRFDEAGNQVSLVPARGRGTDGSVDPSYETTWVYDAAERLVTFRQPGGQTTTTTYTAGDEVASIDIGGDLTTYTWDEGTRTKTMGGDASGSSSFDPAGNLLRSVAGSGAGTMLELDTSGRVVAETDSALVTTTYRYDAMGLVVAESDDQGRQRAMTYDRGHRVVEAAANGVVELSRTYDVAGRLVTETNAVDGTTSYEYDNRSRVRSVINSAGTTSYEYDLDDHLVGVVDGNGQRTAYDLDPVGRRLAKTVAGATWTFGYDDDGTLVSLVDPDGRSTAKEVDPSGQVVGIVHSQAGQPTIEIEQTYDSQGRRTSLTDPTGTQTFSYDDRGGLVEASGPAGKFIYDYTTPGTVSVSYPDGTTVDHTMDDRQAVMAVSAPGVDVSYLRDDLRRVTGIASGNGLFETRDLDDRDRVVSQHVQCGVVTVIDTRYGYDDIAPLGWDRTVGSRATLARYGYDDGGRIAAQSLVQDGSGELPGACTDPTASTAEKGEPIAPVNGDAPEVPVDAPDPAPRPGLEGLTPSTVGPISYDAIGNRVKDADVSNTYGPGDRLLSSDGRSFTYDRSGSLTSETVDGATTRYRYDAAGRLSEVDLPDGRRITYGHDGDGIRVRKTVDSTTTTYSWDRTGTLPLLALETIDAPGTDDDDFRRYIYGVGLVAMQNGAGTFYVHADARGDVVALSDASGAIVKTYAYDADGEAVVTTTTDAPENPMRYGAQYLDLDTGLYHLRARDYDPSLGRFTTRDPVTLAVGSPVVSPYVYADNRPTIQTDFTGRTAAVIELAGRSTESANYATVTRTSVSTYKFGLKGVLKASGKLLTYQAAKLAPGTAAAASNASRVSALSKVAKGAGAVLSVAGIALSAYIVYQDCAYGPAHMCAGSIVGAAFNVGCLAATGVAGNVACAAAGIAMQYIVQRYGAAFAGAAHLSAEQKAELAAIDVPLRGLVKAIMILDNGINAVGAAFVADMTAIGNGTVDLANTVADFTVHIGETIASDFNAAADAVATGFVAVIDTLSPSIEIAVAVLAVTFEQGLAATTIWMIDRGEELEAIATATAAQFVATAETVGSTFRDLGYEVEAVASAVDAAFRDAGAWSEAALVDTLRGLEYAADEVALGLTATYDLTKTEFVNVYLAMGAGLDDIEVAFAHAFTGITDVTEAVVAEIITIGLAAGLALTTITDALSDAFIVSFDEISTYLVGAYQALGYTLADIGDAFVSAYDATAQQLVAVYDAAGIAYAETRDAMLAVYAALSPENFIAAFEGTGYAIEGVYADTVEFFDVSFTQLGSMVEGGIAELGGFFATAGSTIGSTATTVVKALDPTSWF